MQPMAGPQLEYANVRPTIYDDYKAGQSSEGPGSAWAVAASPNLSCVTPQLRGSWVNLFGREVTIVKLYGLIIQNDMEML